MFYFVWKEFGQFACNGGHLMSVNKNVIISVSLPENLVTSLDEYCKEYSLSRSAAIRVILCKRFKELE